MIKGNLDRIGNMINIMYKRCRTYETSAMEVHLEGRIFKILMLKRRNNRVIVDIYREGRHLYNQYCVKNHVKFLVYWEAYNTNHSVVSDNTAEIIIGGFSVKLLNCTREIPVSFN